MFYSEYYLSTWQNGLAAYAPFVILGLAILFIIGAIFYMFSGGAAPSAIANEVVTLPSATDLGFKMDYNFSERGSVMIRLTNLLSNEYAIYQNYPVRGFQALGGITWKF